MRRRCAVTSTGRGDAQTRIEYSASVLRVSGSPLPAEGARFKASASLLGALAVVALASSVVAAQRGAPPPAPAARPFRIVKMDPALDAIIAPDARLEVLGDRFGLTEAPLWVPQGSSGSLLFSDLIANVIYQRTAGGQVSVFLDRAGHSGDDINSIGQQTRRGRMAVILTGPNGLTMDPQGRIVYCAMGDRTVVRLEKDGTRTILADRYEGKRFGGPNDVIVKSDGAVYFT